MSYIVACHQLGISLTHNCALIISKILVSNVVVWLSTSIVRLVTWTALGTIVLGDSESFITHSASTTYFYTISVCPRCLRRTRKYRRSYYRNGHEQGHTFTLSKNMQDFFLYLHTHHREMHFVAILLLDSCFKYCRTLKFCVYCATSLYWRLYT